MTRLRDEPHVSLYCACGAQWHGRFAVDNPVIQEHAIRALWPAARNVLGCAIVSAEDFARRGHRIAVPHWSATP